MTQYTKLSAAQALLYLLAQAKKSADEELYHIAATYLEDAEMVKYELDRIAIVM